MRLNSVKNICFGSAPIYYTDDSFPLSYAGDTDFSSVTEPGSKTKEYSTNTQDVSNEHNSNPHLDFFTIITSTLPVAIGVAAWWIRKKLFGKPIKHIKPYSQVDHLLEMENQHKAAMAVLLGSVGITTTSGYAKQTVKTEENSTIKRLQNIEEKKKNQISKNDFSSMKLKAQTYTNGLINAINQKTGCMAGAIKAVYKENDTAREFLSKYFSDESRLPDNEWLKLYFKEDIEKTDKNYHKNYVEDLEVLQKRVDSAYETGDLLGLDLYIPESIQSKPSNNKKLSDEDKLVEHQQQLKNLVTETLTLYINKLFGKALVQQQHTSLEKEFKKNFTKLQKLTKDSTNNLINATDRQDWRDKTEKIKQLKSRKEVAQFRLNNMEYLVSKAEIILNNCLKTFYDIDCQIKKALSQKDVSQHATRLIKIQEINTQIKKDLATFYKEQQGVLEGYSEKALCRSNSKH